jgi:hypothetical protein
MVHLPVKEVNTIAFSSEVGTGLREENASRKELQQIRSQAERKAALGGGLRLNLQHRTGHV